MSYTPKQELEMLKCDVDELAVKARTLKDAFVKATPNAKKTGRTSLLQAFDKIIKHLDAAYNVNLYDDME